MPFFVHRSRPVPALHRMRQNLLEWNTTLATQKSAPVAAVARIKSRLGKHAHKRSKRRDRANVQQAMDSLKETVEVWSGIEGDESNLFAFARAQTGDVFTLPERISAVKRKTKESDLTIYFLHMALHGRPRGMPPGTNKFPCETSDLGAPLFKADQMRIQIAAASRAAEAKRADGEKFEQALTK